MDLRSSGREHSIDSENMSGNYLVSGIIHGPFFLLAFMANMKAKRKNGKTDFDRVVMISQPQREPRDVIEENMVR
ncbi:hypothetical protein EVAR_86147_1 [Eumeta japonica]|uniref:Uncharacterized protein n=1 Tax=Eumeta variegata TaxID=151549 RepID=A0A4C1V2J6_EUMVA|nr:hypothetical protein EVAR_86147_1 [Eumeta japonica]